MIFHDASPIEATPADLPDELTIANGFFWDSRPVYSIEENVRINACLTAWERGAISGYEAMMHLDEFGLLDHDTMVGLYLDFLRAKAEGGEIA